MRKPAAKLLKSIDRLRSVLSASRGHLAAALAARPAAPRGVAAGYAQVLDHFHGELATVAAELRGAELEVGAAELRMPDLRRDRELAAERLYAAHRQIERFWRSQPPLKGADIVGRTPESPDALARQVELTVGLLRRLEADAATARKPVLTPGVRMDAGVLADELERGLPPLKKAITAVVGADSDMVAARCRADAAFAAADRVVSFVAGALESLSGLAGEERLAGRIRRCGG